MIEPSNGVSSYETIYIFDIDLAKRTLQSAKHITSISQKTPHQSPTIQAFHIQWLTGHFKYWRYFRLVSANFAIRSSPIGNFCSV